MIRYWSMEMIKPPLAAARPHATVNSVFTEEGREYRKQCAAARCRPEYVAGEHYVASEGEGRVLVPDLPALKTLRHRWCWERRADFQEYALQCL